MFHVFQERSNFLRRWFDLMIEHQTELAKVLTAEMVSATYNICISLNIYIIMPNMKEFQLILYHEMSQIRDSILSVSFIKIK